MGVVVAGIVGVAYYTYTSSQTLNARVDTCDQEISQLKVKLQGMESIFAKPPIEDLAPMFNLSHQPKPFNMAPQWPQVPPQEEPLFCDITEEESPDLSAVPKPKGLKKDPWLSSSSESVTSHHSSHHSSRRSSCHSTKE